MTTERRGEKTFDLLADIVASDRLMLFTGSGVSEGLLDQDGAKLLGWQALLRQVARESDLPPEEIADILKLLRGTPSGQEMIEAASILEQNEEAFTASLSRKLSPRDFEQQPLEVREAQERRHEALLSLQPRGIVTLNIDRGHEKALERRGELEDWCRINPLRADSEAQIRRWLANQDVPILFEAHGSLADRDAGFVFSHRAYRQLLHKNPAYRALLRYLFSEYRFLFVGFGLTDLDFDQFLHEHSMDFGEPLQEHVVVRKGGRKNAEIRQEVRYRRRFGIHVLNVRSYDDVWAKICKAMLHKGPALRRSLAQCMALDVDERRRAHKRLTELGPAGRAVATRHLLEEVERERSQWRATEAIYSLRYLRYRPEEPARHQAKEALFRELEEPRNSERVAHALSAIEDFLDREDLERMERATAHVRRSPLKTPPGLRDPDRRSLAYAEAILLRLRAKYQTFPPRACPPLVPRE